MNEVVMIMGYPGSGKTTLVEEFPGYVRLNRDKAGGSLEQLATVLNNELITKGSSKSFILDNTYPTIKSRKTVIDVCKKHQVPVRCIHLRTSIEDAQYNVCQRMIERYGKLLMPEDIATVSKTDPNMFPTAVLFKYRKEFEEPYPSEGFAKIEVRKFERRPQGPAYKNQAVIFDYDGTLRKTKSGAKYPIDPDDIEILPGRSEVLRKMLANGNKLLGVSNQGDVARGKLTLAQAVACFERTNDLLGINIEYAFCPHNPAPIQCYCRKPMCGLGVQWIEKYKLDKTKTMYVGDMTTDKTFAGRAGIGYMDANDVFR